ncbi:MAG TPA: DUF3800 domain-containing protein [Rhizomicrobium sp.]|nr:DUF3800 domain-containing protein [Rhizomicrobium sp.]
MHYLIYCDESDDKGSFYSNFYGGSLLKIEDRQTVESALKAAKGKFGNSEFKWTKLGTGNEAEYRSFVEAYFEFVKAGIVKFRAMFTQNINQTKGWVEYDNDGEEFFMLYYQFLKHAFGLRYCSDGQESVTVTVYMDDGPDTKSSFDGFRKYLSGLTNLQMFSEAGVTFPLEEITSVDSQSHVILQATDVVLGAIQFKLNNKHLEKPEGSRVRGKRTRAKERVYKRVNQLIREIYPHFNVGVSTGYIQLSDRWHHPYRHWCFTPIGSVKDISRGKKAQGKKKKKKKG